MMIEVGQGGAAPDDGSGKLKNRETNKKPQAIYGTDRSEPCHGILELGHWRFRPPLRTVASRLWLRPGLKGRGKNARPHAPYPQQKACQNRDGGTQASGIQTFPVI